MKKEDETLTPEDILKIENLRLQKVNKTLRKQVKELKGPKDVNVPLKSIVNNREHLNPVWFNKLIVSLKETFKIMANDEPKKIDEEIQKD